MSANITPRARSEHPIQRNLKVTGDMFPLDRSGREQSAWRFAMRNRADSYRALVAVALLAVAGCSSVPDAAGTAKGAVDNQATSIVLLSREGAVFNLKQHDLDKALAEGLVDLKLGSVWSPWYHTGGMVVGKLTPVTRAVDLRNSSIPRGRFERWSFIRLPPGNYGLDLNTLDPQGREQGLVWFQVPEGRPLLYLGSFRCMTPAGSSSWTGI